jgi:hypothetical protein
MSLPRAARQQKIDDLAVSPLHGDIQRGAISPFWMLLGVCIDAGIEEQLDDVAAVIRRRLDKARGVELHALGFKPAARFIAIGGSAGDGDQTAEQKHGDCCLHPQLVGRYAVDLRNRHKITDRTTLMRTTLVTGK